MTTDPDEFERQLVFCHARLIVAYGFDEPIDPEAAIAALMWLLCDVLRTLPPERRPMELLRIGEVLNDIVLGDDSDESEPVEPPASLALN
jgi:hypothetical protein